MLGFGKLLLHCCYTHILFYTILYSVDPLTLVSGSNADTQERGETPTIISYECESPRETESRVYTCYFYTNTVSQRDHVSWRVVFSTSPLWLCDEEICQHTDCEKQTLIHAREGKDFDTVVCRLEDFVFPDSVYDWSITGSNINGSFTSNVSTVWGMHIVTLEPPTILNYTTTETTLDIQLQLHEKDVLSRRQGQPGDVENDVIVNGITYKVTVQSGLTKHLPYQELTRIFTTKGVTNWLEIKDLEPYTTYDISITNQLSNTTNTHIWSKPTNLRVSTRLPALTYSFSVMANTFSCTSGREVQLYWKIINTGSSSIDSYRLYKVNRITTLPEKTKSATQYSFLPNNSSGSVVVLPASAWSTEMCVDEDAVLLELEMHSTAGVTQSAVSRYHIPSKHNVVNMKACNISVEYRTSNNQLTVEWSLLTSSYNYTVFWCKTEFGDQCTEEVDWKTVGTINNYTLTSAANFLRYKFGVSAHSSSGNSSGIIWKECINHLEEDLQPATLTVTLIDLEAVLHVDEKCVKESRRADYYRIKSCRYDAKDERCLDEEHEVEVHPCNRETTVTLQRYAMTYAFWVTSYAGGVEMKSNIIVRQTQLKGSGWVVLLIALPFAVGVALSIILAARCKEKQKELIGLKKPSLVKPTDLMSERDALSTIEESGEENFNENIYQQHLEPPLLLPLHAVGSCTSVREASEITYKCLAVPVDEPTTLSSSNKKPHITTHSCNALPNYYVRCVNVTAPESDLSAELFSSLGDSADRKIDLSSFLVSECESAAHIG